MYSLTIINVQFFSATCYANIVGCCRRVSGFDYRHKAKQHNNRQMETDGLNTDREKSWSNFLLWYLSVQQRRGGGRGRGAEGGE